MSSSLEQSKTSVACSHCDLLVELPSLEPGEKATCPRCSHTLLAIPEGGAERLISLAIASLGLLALSISHPFMLFSGAGMQQEMTLLGSSVDLSAHGRPFLAAIVFAMVVALPTLYLVGSLSILIPLAKRKRSRSFPILARIVFAIAPWTMADVFLLGTLVSLTKIAALATVGLGFSFGAFVVFVIVFARMTSGLNKEWIWREWERLPSS
ncbi:MAG: paraquat-inducible protein A [Verrucomicrobiota bacterium]